MIYGYYVTNTQNTTPETEVFLFSDKSRAMKEMYFHYNKELSSNEDCREDEGYFNNDYALIQCADYHIEYGFIEKELL